MKPYQPTERGDSVTPKKEGAMKRPQYTVNADEAAALIRAYSYLVRLDCRWLANMPGIDRQRLRETYKAQQRGEVWAVQDLIDMARKPVLTFPAATIETRAA